MQNEQKQPGPTRCNQNPDEHCTHRRRKKLIPTADVSATLSRAQAVFAMFQIGLPLLNEGRRGGHGTEAAGQRRDVNHFAYLRNRAAIGVGYRPIASRASTPCSASCARRERL